MLLVHSLKYLKYFIVIVLLLCFIVPKLSADEHVGEDIAVVENNFPKGNLFRPLLIEDYQGDDKDNGRESKKSKSDDETVNEADQFKGSHFGEAYDVSSNFAQQKGNVSDDTPSQRSEGQSSSTSQPKGNVSDDIPSQRSEGQSSSTSQQNGNASDDIPSQGSEGQFTSTPQHKGNVQCLNFSTLMETNQTISREPMGIDNVLSNFTASLNPLEREEESFVGSVEDGDKRFNELAAASQNRSFVLEPTPSHDNNDNSNNRIRPVLKDRVWQNPIPFGGNGTSSHTSEETVANIHHVNRSQTSNETPPQTHFMPERAPQFSHPSTAIRPNNNNNSREPTSPVVLPDCFADYDPQPESQILPKCPLLLVFNRVRYCSLGSLSCTDSCGVFRPDAGCSCFPICKVYKTCCTDYTEVCTPPDSANDTGIISHEDMVCSSLLNANVVTKCPAVINDGLLLSACEAAPTSFWDIFPVTDSKTGHQFKNLACWKCWDMTGEALFWKAKFYIDSHHKHVDEQNITALYTFIVENPRKGKWTPPEGYEIQMCNNCAVSECVGCTNPELDRLCRSHIAPIKAMNIVYQNMHCHKCSKVGINLQERNENCSLERPTFYTDGPEDAGIEPSPWSAIRLNISSDQLTVRQEESTSPDRLPWQQLQCHADDSVCRVTACPPPDRLTNGRCVDGSRYFTGTIHVCVGFSQASQRYHCDSRDGIAGQFYGDVGLLRMRILLAFHLKAVNDLAITDIGITYEEERIRFHTTDKFPLGLEKELCNDIPLKVAQHVLDLAVVHEPTRVCTGCVMTHEVFNGTNIHLPDFPCFFLNHGHVSKVSSYQSMGLLAWSVTVISGFQF